MDFMEKKFMSEFTGLVYVSIKFNDPLTALAILG